MSALGCDQAGQLGGLRAWAGDGNGFAVQRRDGLN
jgi:hypothetical protein